MSDRKCYVLRISRFEEEVDEREATRSRICSLEQANQLAWEECRAHVGSLLPDSHVLTVIRRCQQISPEPDSCSTVLSPNRILTYADH
jgi:hypothetical protein